MKLRHFLGCYAEDAMGMKFWTAIALAKKLVRDAQTAEGLEATGRGPGSGPDATPYAVAKLLIAALADVPSSEVPKAVPLLYLTAYEGNDTGAGAWADEDGAEPPSKDIPCPLTGALLFGEAMKALLSDAALTARVDRVEVRRGAKDASIYWRDGDALRRSRFVTDYDRAELDGFDARGKFRAVCSIGGAMLRDMAEAIADE